MIFATDQTVPIQELAPELEARGFESLWVTEKTHVPVRRATPWPGGPRLPEWYKRTFDPLVALAAAASVTRSLRLGTGTLLLAARDPVITAKSLATIDWLSGGRLELGVGYGWNREELATHGVDLQRAPEILADKLRLMNEIWNHDEAAYAGPHVSIERSWSWPKPQQRPHPPIHFGGRASRRLFAHIADLGDGWLPIEGWGPILDRVAGLRDAFDERGREPGSVTVTIYSSQGGASTLDRYDAAGITRVVLSLPSADRRTVLATLDRYARQLGDYLHPAA